MITQDQIKECLSYDPETGIFTWLKSTNNRVRIGQRAGFIRSDGYRRIMVNRKRYFAHRITFLFMTGSFPSDEIDHVNGRRDDNRWANLREANRYQNMRNSGKPVTNTSGFKGVVWNKGAKKWLAQIGHMNRKIHLGLFETAESAHKAYIAACVKLHGEYANCG